MSRAYPVLTDGEVWDVGTRSRQGRWNMKIGCCDCGLIHLYSFRIKKKAGRVHLIRTAWREPRATAAMRRGKDHRGLKLPKRKTK